jgi:hypothetical protein
MEILPVGVELHSDGQTDQTRHVAICSFANSPDKGKITFLAIIRNTSRNHSVILLLAISPSFDDVP